MYLPCISSVFLPLYSVHSDVLYRCVSCMYRRCIVMYRSCAWCPRLCYYIDTCGGIDFLQYWTIQCRIQVSYMYQMYCESLGGNSVVSQLALMSARCLGRRDLPTLLAYYPYYCILPLPPTPASYYPYYPCLLPLLPLLPPTIPLLPLVPPTTPSPTYFPLLPLLPPTYSTTTTPATSYYSCYSYYTYSPYYPTARGSCIVYVFSMYCVSIVYGIDVFLRACIGAWIVFFLDV